MFQHGWKARRAAAQARQKHESDKRNDPQEQLKSQVHAERRHRERVELVVAETKCRHEALVSELIGLRALVAKMDAAAMKTGMIDDRAQATEYKISKMPGMIKRAESEIKTAQAALADFDKASAVRLAEIEAKMVVKAVMAEGATK